MHDRLRSQQVSEEGVLLQAVDSGDNVGQRRLHPLDHMLTYHGLRPLQVSRELSSARIAAPPASLFGDAPGRAFVHDPGRRPLPRESP
jgi:hypothetical protein